MIAEPSEQALREFERIVQAIISPPKLIPLFQNSDLRLFSPQDPLVKALEYMREHDYSQVVIQTEGKLSLLTVEGIWQRFQQNWAICQNSIGLAFQAYRAQYHASCPAS